MQNKKSLKKWLNELETRHNKKIDLGLKRVNSVYKSLQLENNPPITLTVAGSNGKGSTVAMISAICQAAGYNVGEFTSPHILSYNERIKINSNNVSDEQIIKAFELIEKNLNGITLSYFEYSTLAALIIFKQEQIDIRVLEVGLGGRLDSTNIVDTNCAVITTISLDHTDWLGDTIEAIAYEKAGIMRNNKPVIYGDSNCPESIIQHAKKIGAALKLMNNCENTTIHHLNIRGSYQQKNAKTAVLALQSLSSELLITEQNINFGLSNIKLSGRLEVFSKNPEIIIDVSHNEQAAHSLAQWLQENPIKGKTIAVFAVLKDKTAVNWLSCFKELVDLWCISQANSSRSLSINELINDLSNSSTLITSFKTIELATKSAKIISSSEDRIIIFGSFYTVSEALQCLKNDC